MSSALNDKIQKTTKMKVPTDDCKENHFYVNEYKILILGDAQVGKSSICNRFTMNEFNLEIKPSNSNQSECYTKSLKVFDHYIRLYLIDVDLQEYKIKREALCEDITGIIIVYDITKPASFDMVDTFKAEVQQTVGGNVPMMILGNKCDLNTLRNVEKSVLCAKGKELKCEFKEVNCIEMNMVNEAMKGFISRIYYENLPQSQQDHYMNLFNSH